MWIWMYRSLSFGVPIFQFFYESAENMSEGDAFRTFLPGLEESIKFKALLV